MRHQDANWVSGMTTVWPVKTETGPGPLPFGGWEGQVWKQKEGEKLLEQIWGDLSRSPLALISVAGSILLKLELNWGFSHAIREQKNMLHRGAPRSNDRQPGCTLMARSGPPVAFVNELLHFPVRHGEPVGKLAPNRKISQHLQQQKGFAVRERGKWRNWKSDETFRTPFSTPFQPELLSANAPTFLPLSQQIIASRCWPCRPWALLRARFRAPGGQGPVCPWRASALREGLWV